MRFTRRTVLSLLVIGVLIAAPRLGLAWQQTISGQVSANGTSVAIDADDHVIAGGYIADVPNAVGAFAVVKLQAGDGTELWRYTLGSPPSGGEAEALALTSANDVVAAGKTSPDGSVTRFAVVKLNGADGTLAWSVEISGTAANLPGSANAVAVDDAGDVLAAGKISNLGNGEDFFVVKLSGVDGAELWRRTLSGSANDADFAAAMVLDANGDVLAAGSTVNTATEVDFTVVKLSGADGSVLWQQDIDGPLSRFDRAWDVAVDAAGGVYATGYVTSLAGPLDIEVVKLDGGDGSILWEMPLDGGATGADEASALALDASGNVVVTGYATSFLGGPMYYIDMIVAKLEGSSGAELWRTVLDGGQGTNDIGYDIAIDAAGDVVAGGSMQRFDTFDDFTMVKLDGSSGIEQWRRTLKGATPYDYYERASAVALDRKGHAVAVGRTGADLGASNLLVLDMQEEISGHALRLSTSRDDPDVSKLMVVSNDPGILAAGPGGPADVTVSGATLEIFNPATAEVATVDLPANHWQALPAKPGSTTVPRAYSYSDIRQEVGPCMRVILAPGSMKAACKGGIGFSLDEPSQGSIAINLKAGNGAVLHCMLFGGTIGRDTPQDGKPGIFKAVDADAPPACAVP